MKSVLIWGFALLLASLVHGDGDALYKQGAALYETDPSQAFGLFVQAAEAGNPLAMAGSGHCCETGTGTTIDYAKAIEWYEKAITHNSLKACEGLARIYASCDDPEFHDGEKAVKYASVIARKKPRDPEALSLLAAAHARNMDFEQAVRFAGKALSFERRAAVSVELRRRKDGYEQGIPYPEVATQAWEFEALDRNFQWAVDRMLWRVADRIDPLYDPEQAIRVCEAGIKAGNKRLYVVRGNLYLYVGNLDEARKCYERSEKGDWGNQETGRFHPIQLSYSPYLGEDRLDRILEKANRSRATLVLWIVSGTGRYSSGKEFKVRRSFDTFKAAKGFTSDSSDIDNISIRKYWLPPKMDEAEFLWMIASARGSQEARKQLAELEEQMRHSRSFFENGEGADNVLWAAGLNAEAVKYCNNDVFPVNLPLAARFLEKSYALAPSAKTACMLGSLYLRDNISLYNFEFRPVDKAIRWLEIAHAEGYQPATRRLIEFYACDSEKENCNAELALQYATTYAEAHPPNDYDALRLLAYAYASSERYEDAIDTVQKALEGNAGDRGLLRVMKMAKNKEPFSRAFYSRYDNDTGKTTLFSDWAKTLNAEDRAPKPSQ